jgi:hypothetical protein
MITSSSPAAILNAVCGTVEMLESALGANPETLPRYNAEISVLIVNITFVNLLF